MKIIQLGCFNRNFGDSIALMNPRRTIKQRIKSSKWEDLCLVEKFHSHRCNVKKSTKQFEEITENNDVLFVGGAGLVESWPGTFGTHWKLPFDKTTLGAIKIPIVVYGVGLNFHRRCQDMTEKAFYNLCLLIEQSKLFSVRSDGSYEKLYELFERFKVDKKLFDRVTEVPDAGLIFPKGEQNKRVETIEKKIFNSAWSSKLRIRKHSRRLHLVFDSAEIIDTIRKEFIFYPHTPKDYNKTITKKYLFSRKDFEELVQTRNVFEALSYYKKFHLMFGLHAHAQLISLGKNVPCISYSSFDKTGDFVKKHDLMEFDIDPENYTKKQVEEKFLELNNRFCNDKEFLDIWYEKRDNLVTKSHLLYKKEIEKICEIIK